MQFHTVADLGPKRKKTGQGFMLCEDVPLARVGFQTYMPGEIPVSPGPNGYIEIERSADEVFAPTTMASYQGAPFVDDHPWEDVTPQNWRALAGGIVLNPRRGEGDLSEWVLGDVLVTAPELIEAIEGGKREVSVGYDCDYDEIAPGRGRQRNIIVNHVALVRKGRCGPSCAIGDSAPEELPHMTTHARKPAKGGVLKRTLDKLRAAVATKDEEAIESALEATEAAANMEGLAGDEAVLPGPTSPEHHVHLHMGDDFPPKKDKEDEEEKPEKTEDDENPLEARVAALESGIGEIKTMVQALGAAKEAPAAGAVDDEKILGELKEEAPPGTNDAAMTKDSAFLEASYVDTVSMAEIIAPGIQPPQFVRAEKPAKTFDSICGHRRAALKAAIGQAAARPALAKFVQDGLRGKTVDTLTCAETRGLFRGAGALASAMNSSTKTADVHLPAHAGGVVGPVKSIRELNDRSRAKYHPK